ncbi:hypothetical protein BUALT_Bualt02G0239100 [Buddleja alternifolia]|uniref:Di19 zinc-binding domain-containing protein n=1 Tax=Buddleja alternifolia TaxID=168488 RepID=A0AAV6Y8V7_9LAMI|nr:hypothetical protein BUALT_Bualt02G0239100 [Buddleja alternifolia]
MDRFCEDLEIELSSYSMHGTCVKFACNLSFCFILYRFQLVNFIYFVGFLFRIVVIDDYYEEEEETEGEYEGEEVNDVENVEKSEELACPFCPEDFDVLGLCCHIDADHRMEVKPGICPVCATKVRINMASHTNRSARSRSAIFLLRKELQEKHSRSVQESPSIDSSFDPAADSMLLSFVNNPKPAYRPQTVETASSTSASLSGESSIDESSHGHNIFFSLITVAEFNRLSQRTGTMRVPGGVNFYRD